MKYLLGGLLVVIGAGLYRALRRVEYRVPLTVIEQKRQAWSGQIDWEKAS